LVAVLSLHFIDSHSPSFHVAAVQLENVLLDALVQATRELPENIDWVVWPEYAVPYDIRQAPQAWETVNALVAERGIILTFGTRAEEEGAGAWSDLMAGPPAETQHLNNLFYRTLFSCIAPTDRAECLLSKPTNRHKHL